MANHPQACSAQALAAPPQATHGARGQCQRCGAHAPLAGRFHPCGKCGNCGSYAITPLDQ